MIARLLLALALLFTGPAFAQQSITQLPQVATPVDADLFPLDVQSYPLGQRTHSVSAAGLARYLLGKIPMGPQGIPGNTGLTGPATQLSIGSTTTGAAGTSALVTIAGQAPAQTLSFTIPTGAAGPQGTAGPTGTTGPAGPQGMVGATGIAGPPNTLSVGTVTTSAPGGSASASVSGSSPNQALNLTLPQGIQGPVGPVGPTGSGQGNVLGPTSATTAGDIAVFSDTTGTRLSDGGALGPAATKPLAFFLLSANNLSDLGSTSTARTNLGLGGAALLNVGTAAGTVAAGNDSRITGALQAASNLSDLASAATARTNLGLGTAAVQPSSYFLQASNNLSDLASVTTARTNLGLGTLATQAASGVTITGGTINGVATTGGTINSAPIGGTAPAAGAFTTLSATTPVAVAFGGTGGSTAAAARSGLGAAASGTNSDITNITGLTTALSVGQGGTGGTTASAARTSLGAAASGANTDITSLASPALGAATATTQAAGDSSTKVATTAQVQAAIAAGSGGGSGSGFPSAFATKSANYTVATADKNTLFNLSGSFTLTLPSASSFGAGNGIYLSKTDGNGAWAVTPASGTIDGLSSISVYQERFALVSDGTNWRSVNRSKGWVNIGTTTLAANTSAVNFTIGFGDAELRDMQFDAGLVMNGSSGPQGAVAKGGAYLTSGYVTRVETYTGTTAATTSVVTSGFDIGDPADTTYFFDAMLFSFSSNNYQRFSSQAFAPSGGATRVDGRQSGTAGAITGFQVSGSMASGSVLTQRGFRP